MALDRRHCQVIWTGWARTSVCAWVHIRHCVPCGRSRLLAARRYSIGREIQLSPRFLCRECARLGGRTGVADWTSLFRHLSKVWWGEPERLQPGRQVRVFRECAREADRTKACRSEKESRLGRSSRASGLLFSQQPVRQSSECTVRPARAVHTADLRQVHGRPAPRPRLPDSDRHRTLLPKHSRTV